MTNSMLQLKVLASFLLVFAGSASAATYTNVPNGASTGLPFASFGNAANPNGDSPKVGEVFTLASAETLSSFSFYAVGNTTASFQLNVAQWNSSLVSPGATLLTTIGSATDTYNPTGGFTTIKFDNLGLSLNANTKYIAYLTSSDTSVTGIQLSRTQTANDVSGFGGGSAYLSNIPSNGWQFPFNGFLSLQYTAVTVAVPETETYAMLLAGLGIMGFVARRNKA
jgi:hypothetical protein